MFQRLTLLLTATLLSCSAFASGELNVYSSRQEQLIAPLIEQFSKQTGIVVNVVTGKDDALIERLRIEGRNSPADLLWTADAGRLHRAKSQGLLQPIESEVLEAVIPAHLRDADQQWFGLTTRARPIMYARDRVDPAELSTYEALADPKWKRRICVRSSDNIYNQSLVAAMIEHLGEERTEAWARGLVANFARPPAGGDREQISAVAAGVCDFAIANTYYLGGMLKSPNAADRLAAEKVAVFWPYLDGSGTL
ncbi:MAG: extracellular solute-binding protein, partial [Spongiibacteraceae bacterium]|nr:extracellular solute-binding protein [Spongiibacteraceae bacterium]